MPTSFIPKRILDTPERPRSRPTGLLLIISLFILFVSGVLWGGTFFYKKLLVDQVNKLDESVERERKNLNQSTIVLFQRLDNKLRIAKELLDKHVTLLPAFRLLEDLTLPTIRYGTFDYTPTAITLSGAATSFEDIAVQTQEFAKDKRRIQSFIFSDLGSGKDDEVTFKLTIVPETDLVSYHKFITQ